MRLAIPDPALVLLIGPSGAGKSTFARAHFEPFEIVSSDALRELVSNDSADQGASAEAFQLVSLIISGRLRRRLLTVVDATNLRAAKRRRYHQLAARFGVPVVAIAFDLPTAAVHRHNRRRAGRVVESDVVDRQVELMECALAALPSEGYAALYILREARALGSLSVERVHPDIARR